MLNIRQYSMKLKVACQQCIYTHLNINNVMKNGAVVMIKSIFQVRTKYAITPRRTTLTE